MRKGQPQVFMGGQVGLPAHCSNSQGCCVVDRDSRAEVPFSTNADVFSSQQLKNAPKDVGSDRDQDPLPPDLQADFYLSSTRQIIPCTFPIANYSQEETQIKGQRRLTVSLYLQNKGGGVGELG